MFHGLPPNYLYSAVRLDATFWSPTAGTKTFKGTGFFVTNKSETTCLVTNRHVVDLAFKPNKYSGMGFVLHELIARGFNADPQSKLPQIAAEWHLLHESRIRYSSNPYNDLACLVNVGCDMNWHKSTPLPSRPFCVV